MTRVDTADKLINALSSDNAIDKLICKDVHITNAVLNFTKAANVVLQHCTFDNCIIQNAQLYYGVNEHITLTDCIIDNIEIGEDITDCTLQDCMINASYLTCAIIDTLHITDSHIRNISIYGSSMCNCMLTNNSVQGTVINRSREGFPALYRAGRNSRYIA